MKTKQFISFALSATIGATSLIAGMSTVSASDANDKVKIMSIGDSITDGYWEQGAYRKYMYSDLVKKGYDNIEMVGPKGGGTTSFNYNGETVSYGTSYAGYSGFAIQQMPNGAEYTSGENRSGILETIQCDYDYSKPGVQNMVEAYSPDVVLLQIGTNDILSNYNTNITGRLENLVNVILSGVAEDGVVYVASIPDIDVSIRHDWLGWYGINVWQDGGIEELTTVVQSSIDNYNASIKEMVENMQSQGKSVRFGDINSVVDYKTDLYDGVHPNEAGYENMGLYWSNLLSNDYFGNVPSEEEKPVVTTTVTEEIPVETTTNLTTTEATTAKTTQATTVTTTTTKITTELPTGSVVLEDVPFGESYDLSKYNYENISSIDFVFGGNLAYGMTGCVTLGNWQSSTNFSVSDLDSQNTLNVPVENKYSTMTVNKWYGDTTLEKVIIHYEGVEETTTEATTKTTTTTTTTPKPTTTTTTTTTKATTTTPKPTTTTTTTTTKATTTTPKPTTTTTTTTTTKVTTTTPKPTTTTTTTTTTKATTTTPKPTTTTTMTTTTKATTTTSKSDENNKVVLKDISYNKQYSLEDYDYKNIESIEIKLKGSVGYGFGGKLVLGDWTKQVDYGAAELDKDNTIVVPVKDAYNKMTIFSYWGNMELESVTLVYKN
ncbi:MAG: hypothetical protein IJZ64_01580 [Ruminococcus sp.]|nr:hypothetical protein [Ruminococcus sp.]